MYLAALGQNSQGIGDDFFTDLWNKTVNTGENILTGAVDSAQQAAASQIGSWLGTNKSGSGGTTAPATPAPVQTVPTTTQVMPTTGQTAQTTASASFADIVGSLSQAGWDALSEADKARYRQLSQQTGISIPWDKSDSWLSNISPYVIAGGVAGASYLLSKSLVGSVIAGVGSYFIYDKFIVNK